MRWDHLLNSIFEVSFMPLFPLSKGSFILECTYFSLLILQQIVSYNLSLRINSNVSKLFIEWLDYFGCLRSSSYELSLLFRISRSLCLWYINFFCLSFIKVKNDSVTFFYFLSNQNFLLLLFNLLMFCLNRNFLLNLLISLEFEFLFQTLLFLLLCHLYSDLTLILLCLVLLSSEESVKDSEPICRQLSIIEGNLRSELRLMRDHPLEPQRLMMPE